MTIYRTDRIGRLGGRTALYVSDSLHSFPTRDPVLNSLAESSWVTVRGTERDLLLGVIYRPPSSTEHFNSTLIGVVEHLDRYQHMQIVLMGDFNVPGSHLNLSAPGGNTFAENFRLATSAAGLEEHVQSPTRWGPDATLLRARLCLLQ